MGIFDPESWERYLREGAARMGIDLAESHLHQFALHARELLFWNRRTNLTAITDPEEIAVKHFIDSLVPSRWIPPDARLLDIGSGGGFPGIPLKVFLSSLDVTLIEASRKKVTFLNHVSRQLGLSGICALQGRAEKLGSDRGGKRGFDVVISRAFSSVESFIAMALPLVSENGMIFIMGGKRLPDLPLTRIEILRAEEYQLPYFGFQRHLLCVRPVRSTRHDREIPT
jgi:16S rRNA (guanine527-N7)-methyltransferase